MLSFTRLNTKFGPLVVNVKRVSHVYSKFGSDWLVMAGGEKIELPAGELEKFWSTLERAASLDGKA